MSPVAPSLYNTANMEPEERPAKIRKLEHTGEDTDTVVADSAPVDESKGAEESISREKDTPADNKVEQIQNDAAGSGEGEGAAPKLSKNQLKKLRRHEKWEAGREDRKVKRKEKIKERKERRREQIRHALANGDEAAAAIAAKNKSHKGTPVPITVVFDCDFEDLMFDNEMKSLGLQITRCYSDNRKAKYQAHLAISSFGGKMKERFDGILAQQYTSWKGVRFFSEDFVHVAEKAKEWMTGSDGGTVAGALAENANSDDEEGEIVYLSSESDVTLERLKPNSTYIIGGLVDKNRHKGICYKRAVDRGIKTAKLPIGEFLHMKSRQVLVTNHVLEIMLKWMEFGDWGKAFMAVLPERKGAVLKSASESGAQEEDAEAEEADDSSNNKEAEGSNQPDGDAPNGNSATEEATSKITKTDDELTTEPAAS
jgi:tRNA (guanine9-N1)-methyltransferase